jgi:predicted acyl esterase
MRGRFREGFERAVPMVPGEPTRVRFALSDVLHTVRPGHRMMIQVQSTWFPFIDRNPQKFVSSIFQAKEEDFVLATHSLFRSASHPSKIRLPVLQDSAGGW